MSEKKKGTKKVLDVVDENVVAELASAEKFAAARPRS